MRDADHLAVKVYVLAPQGEDLAYTQRQPESQSRGLSYSLSQWRRELFEGGRLSTWQDTKGFPGRLSQRQWDFRVPSGEGRVGLMVDEPAKRVP